MTFSAIFQHFFSLAHLSIAILLKLFYVNDTLFLFDYPLSLWGKGGLKKAKTEAKKGLHKTIMKVLRAYEDRNTNLTVKFKQDLGWKAKRFQETILSNGRNFLEIEIISVWGKKVCKKIKELSDGYLVNDDNNNVHDEGERGEGGEDPVESPAFVTLAPRPAGILATLGHVHDVCDVPVAVYVFVDMVKYCQCYCSWCCGCTCCRGLCGSCRCQCCCCC